jgi:hypothetical protein
MKLRNFSSQTLLLPLMFWLMTPLSTIRAAETLINFDDVAGETIINTHYSGLTFTNPIGGNIVARNGGGFAPSSPNVVCVTNGGGFPYFEAKYGAVDVHFATPMRVVKIDTRPVAPLEFLTPLTKRPFLQAFDSGNNLLNTVYYAGPLPTNAGQVGPIETLVISSTTTNIAYARFTAQNSAGDTPTYAMFDNLRYSIGSYALNFNVVGSPGAGAFGVISPIGPYYYGSFVTLSVDWFGGPSYNFGGWSGDSNSTVNPLVVFMDSDKNLTATDVHIPQLRITPALNSVKLSWPTNDSGFTLLYGNQLWPSPAWSILPNPRAVVGTNYTVTDNVFPNERFYRLIWAGVEPIPGLFNTGVGTNGTILASGTVDPHWQMVQSPDVSFPGPAAIVVNDTGFPIPPWLTNGPASKWIAPQASQSTGNSSGTYKYRISFNLTGLEPATAAIAGHWTSDNTGPQVLLNGVPTGATSDGNFGALGNAFLINGGFLAGANTLDFVVTNAGPGINPTGVRVELSGTANRQLPP